MCHGISELPAERPLTRGHFDRLMGIAAQLGFESVSYDQLDAWRHRGVPLPDRPIMIDFDHGVISMRHEVLDVLEHYGFKGNLFIDTERMNQPTGMMSWDQVGELMAAGWNIGAHTVTHPDLSQLSLADPDGARIAAELQQGDAAIHQHLGIWPQDFAYTGTSLSSAAIQAVSQRYRFGRLWIIGPEYQFDGATVPYADLVGIEGPPEPDGGPPMAARYITRQTAPHLLPSVDLQHLIYQESAFRHYLTAALTETA